MPWTAADIPDQTGRTVVITGANSGIGWVAARELARAGADLVLAVRDTDKGEAAMTRIRDVAPQAELEVRPLDLADLVSVRAFANDWQGPLDLLINNAGVMATPQRTTQDGFELQFGTNHLGHFALTGLLLEALLAAEDPRVVTLSSGAHRMGRMRWDDLQSERGYQRWRAYGQSKLANLLFAQELGRRANAHGVALRSVAAHPGYASTNLQVAGPRMEGSAARERLGRLGNALFAQSADAGALPTLFAATAPGLPSGSYVGPGGPGEMRGHPTIVGMSRAARDEGDAARLWAVSEELTSVSYPWPEVRAAA
jgi:NAD(P)-dependent dehydrogenase (short-subunit alcohol dehydrogenase family)